MTKHKIRHTKVEDLIIPGQTLKDIMDFNKYDMTEFLKKTGLTKSLYEGLINGTARFDMDISCQLAEFIRLPEDFWYNLQKNYDDESAKIISRQKARERRAAQAKLSRESAKAQREAAKKKDLGK